MQQVNVIKKLRRISIHTSDNLLESGRTLMLNWQHVAEYKLNGFLSLGGNKQFRVGAASYSDCGNPQCFWTRNERICKG